MYIEFISICLIYLTGVQSDTCKTPDNEDGVCVPLPRCKPVLKALLTDEIIDASHLHCDDTGLKICCANVTSEVPTSTTSNSIRTRYNSYCGFQHADDYFHPTDQTIITEYPWLARIGYRRDGENYEEYLCVGSLISRDYILTSAQCLQGDIKPTSIRLGEYHIFNRTDCAFDSHSRSYECSNFEDYSVEKYIVHPGYNKSGELDGIHNIGLIKVNGEVNYTDYIRPICLPVSDIPKLEISDKLTVSGWGWTQQPDNIHIRSKFKQSVIVEVQSNHTCEEQLHPIQEGQGCSLYSQKNVCIYENGGPVAFSYKYRWYQEGVALSGTKSCFVAASTTPLVYTKVFNYIDWIKQFVVLP